MKKVRYMISDAAAMMHVESHVLRYWEEELELRIHRNELGHRYYTGYDIQLFMNIKELKKRGLQLRAIRELIPKLARTARLHRKPNETPGRRDGGNTAGQRRSCDRRDHRRST